MFPWISTLTSLSLPCSLTHSFSPSMSLWFRRFPLCHSRRCVDSRVHFALRWAVSPRLGWYLCSFPISLSQSQPIFQSISVFLSLSVPSQGLVGGISCGHRVCYSDITSWRRVGVNFFLSWSVQRVSLVVPVPDLRVRLGRPWIFGHVSRRQFLFLGISRHLWWLVGVSWLQSAPQAVHISQFFESDSLSFQCI